MRLNIVRYEELRVYRAGVLKRNAIAAVKAKIQYRKRFRRGLRRIVW